MDIPYLMVSECWMLNPMFIVTIYIYIYIGLLMTMNSSMSSISSMANTQDADDE